MRADVRSRASRAVVDRLSQWPCGTALFVSDVPGDDPAVIGSGILGPVAGAAAGAADQVTRRVIARIEDAMQAVGAHAADLRTWISTTRFEGDADRLAVRLTHELCLSGAQVCVWGGESVVRLPANPGRGGRNQHLALAAARLIAGEGELLFLAAGNGWHRWSHRGCRCTGRWRDLRPGDGRRPRCGAQSVGGGFSICPGRCGRPGAHGTNRHQCRGPCRGSQTLDRQARSWYERNSGSYSPVR